jgi:hypothetical protein
LDLLGDDVVDELALKTTNLEVNVLGHWFFSNVDDRVGFHEQCDILQEILVLAPV